MSKPSRVKASEVTPGTVMRDENQLPFTVLRVSIISPTELEFHFDDGLNNTYDPESLVWVG